MVRIIVNGDDFGRSSSINQAIIRAHREGILTSASLMITGEATQEAIALIRQTPTLAVGLHLVAGAGRAILPAHQIPHLVDKHGFFPNDAFSVGMHYAVSRRARSELRTEWRAQVEAFLSTGLSLSHLDSHLHLHLHPALFLMLKSLAEEYGAAGIRIPRDDFWLAISHDRSRAGMKATWAIIFGLLSQWCVRQLRASRLIITDRVYGLMQTGQMTERYVVYLLHHIKAPLVEIYFHPAIEPANEPLGPNPGDLATLISPEVKRVVRERNLQLSTYLSIRKEAGHD